MAKVVLSKIQIPKGNTFDLIAELDLLNYFDQVIVDPQSPTEQARVQELKDKFESYLSRIAEICYRLQIPIENLLDIESKDFEVVKELLISQEEIESFLDKYEGNIISQKEKLDQLNKDERVLSALQLFKDQIDKNDLTIDILSSSSRTFTAYGEIPSSYEEIIRFYLNEITSSRVFFWSTPANGKEIKSVICVSLLDYQAQIEEILKENFFVSTKLDLTAFKTLEDFKDTYTVTKLYSVLKTEIKSTEEVLNTYKSELNTKILHKLSLLKKGIKFLSMEEKGRTKDNTFTIWGWVKQKNYDDFKSNIIALKIDPKMLVLEEVPFSYKKEQSDDEDIISTKLVIMDKETERHIPHLSQKGFSSKGGILFPKKSTFVKLEAPKAKTRQFITFVRVPNFIHPVKIGSLSSDVQDMLNTRRQELTQYLAKVKRIKEKLDIKELNEEIVERFQLADDYSHMKAFVENFLKDYEDKVEEIFKSYTEVKKKKDQVELYLPFEEEFKEKGIEIDLLQSGFQTTSFLGSIPKNSLKAVRFFLNEVTDNNIVFWSSSPSDSKSNETNIFVLSLKDFDTAILRVLNEYSFKAIELDLSLVQQEESRKETKEKLEQQIVSLEEEISLIRRHVSDKLSAAFELLEAELDRINSEEMCQVIENKITLWGWIPQGEYAELNKRKETLPFEVDITVQDNVPLVNPSITKKGKAFGAIRGIVGGIGQPSTQEVDPFYIARFTFPLLFGIMFADVGHGIMLALIGGFLAYRKRKKKIKTSESITGFLYAGSELLAFCGISATVFGFLFGSLLGDEVFIRDIMRSIGVEWLPLINPLHDPKFFLTVALIIGFFMIQLGIILKVIQNIKYGHGIASKLAPATLSLVYVGIFAILYSIIGTGAELSRFVEYDHLTHLEIWEII
ncbi:MAG: hypothetical protein KAJ30_05705, partial [Candidatus Heimdallarchaeota archaeon]|nr:hypothetical protein [Candidatus Heimdallarchaeota archaeon]